MPRTTRPRAAVASVIPKDLLAKEISTIISEEQLTQTKAAYRIKDAPSQLSLIVNGRLRGFSAERLLRILTRLGRDVEIRIVKAKRSPGKVRMVVK